MEVLSVGKSHCQWVEKGNNPNAKRMPNDKFHPIHCSLCGNDKWFHLFPNDFPKAFCHLFYKKVTDVWMPAVMINKFSSTMALLLLELVTSLAMVSNWLKATMLKHMHMLCLTHSFCTHILHRTNTPPHCQLASHWDAFCSADSLYMFTTNGSQLPCIHVPWMK